MIIKGRSPTMRHVSRIHRVALDWLVVRVNLDTKIQIKYIYTKNQLADILTKGNFTRDEWNHLLCLFNNSHFSSAVCFAVMAKRSQKDSGEEWVTEKSRLVMNLIARTPSFVSSSTSSNRRREVTENQDPWKSVAGENRSGQLGKETDYSKPLIITTMSNSWRASLQQIIQNWITTVLGLLKSGKLRLRRTIDQGNLLKLFGEWYDMFDLITKKFFSTEPRNPWGTENHFVIDQGNLVISILKKWQILNISSLEVIQQNWNCLWDQDLSWILEWSSAKKTETNFKRCMRRRRTFWNVDGISDIHGQDFQDNCHSIVNTADLTLKKMFDISAKLVARQDEISNLDTIRWEKHWWKYLSSTGDETVIILQRAKFYVFSDSVLCLGKIHQTSERYSQICQRSHADPRGKESFGETRCKRETNIKPVVNKWLGLYSCGAETMGWHWYTGIKWSFLCQNSSLDYCDSKKVHREEDGVQLWPRW